MSSTANNTTVSAQATGWTTQAGGTPLPTSLLANGHNLIYFLVVDACIAMATCIGNIILLAAFAKNPQLRQRNKMMTALLINLAVSDLFHGAVAIPCFIIPHYAVPDFKSNRVVCILSYVLFQYSIAVSLLLTLAIAVDRYIAIVHPFWKVPKFWRITMKKPVIFLAIWLYPGAGIAALTTWNTLGKTWDWCEASVVLSPYHNIVLGAHLFLVLVVASALYLKIMCFVRQSSKKIRRFSEVDVPRQFERLAENERNKKPKPLNRMQRRASEKEPLISGQDIHVVKTLVLLMTIFYLCFVPAVVKIAIHLAKGLPVPEPMWLNFFDQVFLICLMLSPCLDPIIYSWRNAQLREAIRIMCCACAFRRTKPYQTERSFSVLTYRQTISSAIEDDEIHQDINHVYITGVGEDFD